MEHLKGCLNDKETNLDKSVNLHILVIALAIAGAGLHRHVDQSGSSVSLLEES